MERKPILDAHTGGVLLRGIFLLTELVTATMLTKHPSRLIDELKQQH